MFLQDLFKEKFSWDETLPENLNGRWISLLSAFVQTGHVNVPRYYFGIDTENAEQIEIFGFCDSSQYCYATAVYAKKTSHGQSSVSQNLVWHLCHNNNQYQGLSCFRA